MHCPSSTRGSSLNSSGVTPHISSSLPRGFRQPQPQPQHTAPVCAMAPPFITASSSSSSRRRQRVCAVAAAASAAGQQPQPPQPDLSSIRKAGDIERLLFSQVLQQGGRPSVEKPNAPPTPTDFVEALEMVVRSSGQEVDPEQLDEILMDVVTNDLLRQFDPAQLSTTTKNIAVMCESVRGEFIEALLAQLLARMGDFSTQQLSNIGWGLLRLVPVAEPEVREVVGMDQQWLDSYVAAAEQQLAAVVQAARQQQQRRQQQQQQQQQQQGVVPPVPKLPSAQQVANLLLLPAAAMQPLQPSLLAVMEEVLLLRSASLCGYAVAQLLTCYVRLELRPGQALLDTLLEHMQEELQLYDYDELTQVTFNVYVLQLQLPDTLLADITLRAGALEEAGAVADPGDVEVLREALQRLAAQKVAGVA